MRGLFTSLFMLSSAVTASPLLTIDKQDLNPKQVELAQEILSEIEETLPSKVKNALAKKGEIKVRFERFKENSHLTQLPRNYSCDGATKIKHASISKGNKNLIKISKLYINEVLDENAEVITFNCKQGSYPAMFRAKVLHEVAHAYDWLKIRDAKHWKQFKECGLNRPENMNKALGGKCNAIRKQNRNRNTISGLHSFFKLSNWNRTFFGSKEAKNLYDARKPDAYEKKSLLEHFAVNFEYFLTDEKYKCKRPSYYNYYSKQLNHEPFPNSSCDINTVIKLDDKKVDINIAPERVYRVDYLLASSGSSLISGFGHSMFRLVVCAPHRKVASKECIKDKLYHVVLSYRANIDDIKSNVLKGVTGGYDSLLFMLSFPKVIEEYNLGELRDLLSLPLNLNDEQKTAFINRTLETYWEYRGDYKFITQNCATESHELLQSALPEHEISYGSILKPYSLFDKIIRDGLADDNHFDDLEKATEEGKFFPSDLNLLGNLKFSIFGKESQDYKQIKRKSRGSVLYHYEDRLRDLEDIIKLVKLPKLQSKFEELKTLEATEEKIEKLRELSILTHAVFSRANLDLDEQLGTYLEVNEMAQNSLGEEIRSWNKARINSRVVSTDGDYGIPLLLNTSDIEVFKERYSRTKEHEKNLVHMIKEDFKEGIDELVNLNNLRDLIRLELTRTTLQIKLTQGESK